MCKNSNNDCWLQILFLLILTICMTGLSETKELDNEQENNLGANDCNKTKFIENYVRGNSFLSFDASKDVAKSCLNKNLQCSRGASLMAIYVQSALSNQYFWYVLVQNLNHTRLTECWGHALIVEFNNGTDIRFINFEDNSEKTYRAFIPVIQSFTYEFKLISIPSNESIHISIKAPNDCENKVIDYIYQQIEKKSMFSSCGDKRPGFISQQKAASEICKLYPGSDEHQLNITERLLVEINCQFHILKGDIDIEGSTKKYLDASTIAAIVTLSLLLSFGILALVLILRRRKQPSSIHLEIRHKDGTGNLLHLVGIKRLRYYCPNTDFNVETSVGFNEQLVVDD